jgi:hypothetical protein
VVVCLVELTRIWLLDEDGAQSENIHLPFLLVIIELIAYVCEQTSGKDDTHDL